MTSREDREVLHEVWSGRIPTVFSLSFDEYDSEESPDPCYIMLPRMSYLPLATDKVKKHFSGYNCEEGHMWFSFNGSPLKWHHPIGLLFDVLSGGPESDDSLPWSLTVHFTKFPTDLLLPCHTREQIETVFMSSLKEADQLKHSGKVVSMMQKKDHNQLWLGLSSDKFDQFWAINRKFMEPLPGEESFKHIPIRFYIGGNDNSLSSSILQKLVTCGSQTQPKLLGDLVQEMEWENAKLVIQGVQPDMQVPLEWLARHLAYPDNFLHIAVFL